MTMTILAHPPSQIVRQLLIDLVVAGETTADWPAFYGREPAAPDNCISVYTTQSTAQGRQMVDGKLVEKRGLQVRIRSATEKIGWTRADLIRGTLAGQLYRKVVHVDDASYLIHSADRIGDILNLGTESPTSIRSVHTLNFVAAIRQL